MPLDPELPKGICKKGEKNLSLVSSGSKAQLTVVGCVNAAGYCILSMVIMDRKTLRLKMLQWVKFQEHSTVYLIVGGWIVNFFTYICMVQQPLPTVCPT